MVRSRVAVDLRLDHVEHQERLRLVTSLAFDQRQPVLRIQLRYGDLLQVAEFPEYPLRFFDLTHPQVSQADARSGLISSPFPSVTLGFFGSVEIKSQCGLRPVPV